MDFVVVAPPYAQLCGGTSVLYDFARRLHEKGHNAKVFVEGHTHVSNPIYNTFTDGSDITDTTIVIYPESIVGNPARAKTIVRLVLYGAHLYDQYEPNERIYYHAKFCKNNPTQKFLTILRWPPGFFNKGLARTNRSCFVVKKGMRIPEIRSLIQSPSFPRGRDSVFIEGWSHDALCDVFNRTTYFYCYDPCCFLIVMALLCGCIVIQHPVPHYTAEEWRTTIGLPGLSGIAYGEENLAHAHRTIADAPRECDILRRESDATVDAFLRDMKEGTYSTDPCYPFNTSPYALQHVVK